MNIFLAWLMVASVQLAATVSPGPAFVMATHAAVRYGRRAAIYTAFGLGAGISVHILFVLIGLSFVIAQSVFLYNLIKYAGAAYLFYIGVKALRSGKKKSAMSTMAVQEETVYIPCFRSFYKGFLTNTLNPKAVIFFTAVFSQFISPETSLGIKILYGATSVFIEITWFILVALFLTHPLVRRSFMKITHWVERVCGGLMIALGLKLVLTR